jgi:cellulose biosynthesis protein BcsQ|tara:strand:+ start:558 stop:1127 length:570 start_codon:yes stop_codon:yes gene_type:complete
MKTIAFINKKGGVGKTTTLSLVALALADRGHKVGVVNADKQTDATKAVKDLNHPNIKMKEKGKDSHDFYLMDSGGGITDEEINKIEKFADIIIIPSNLDEPEIDNTKLTINIFKSLKKVRVLFTRLERREKEYKFREVLRSAFSAPVLKTEILYRPVFKRAKKEGWKSLDKQAKDNVNELVDEILNFNK